MQTASIFDKPCTIFSSLNIIPSETQSKGEKINTIFRLIVAVSLVMYLYNQRYAFAFLIVGIMVLFILHHYPIKKEHTIEGYRPHRSPLNRRVNTVPVIAPRSHDLSHWNPGAYQHSHINAEKAVDMSQFIPPNSESGLRPWQGEYVRNHQPQYPCAVEARMPPTATVIEEFTPTADINDDGDYHDTGGGYQTMNITGDIYDDSDDDDLTTSDDKSENKNSRYNQNGMSRREYFSPATNNSNENFTPGAYTPQGSDREIFYQSIQPTGRPQNATPYNTQSVHDYNYAKMYPANVEAYKDWREHPEQVGFNNSTGQPVALSRQGPACSDCNCIEPIHANLGISVPSMLASQLGSIPAYDQHPQLAGVSDRIARNYHQTLGNHGSSLVAYGNDATNEAIFKHEPQHFRIPPKIGTASGDTVDTNALRYLPQRNPNVKFMSGPCTAPPRDGRNVGLATGEAYVDTQLGQVRYDYSEIDAYRSPNFIYRSNVDFIDYIYPDGRRIPEYFRTPMETRAQTEHAFHSSAMTFREDMMERLLRKQNSINCQLRHAPLRSDSSSHRSGV